MPGLGESSGAWVKSVQLLRGDLDQQTAHAYRSVAIRMGFARRLDQDTLPVTFNRAPVKNLGE